MPVGSVKSTWPLEPRPMDGLVKVLVLVMLVRTSPITTTIASIGSIELGVPSIVSVIASIMKCLRILEISLSSN